LAASLGGFFRALAAAGRDIAKSVRIWQFSALIRLNSSRHRGNCPDVTHYPIQERIMAKKMNPKAPKDKSAKAAKPAKEKKVSAFNAAAQVLAKANEPMNCIQLIEAMSKAGLWSSPNGATPQATLYSAITREINTKGKEARFKKVERGHFAAK
jgi:hypothetical protein